MAVGRREAFRKLAVDIANCGNPPQRIDWDLFHRTGEFRQRKQRDPAPLVQAELDRITANGGRF